MRSALRQQLRRCSAKPFQAAKEVLAQRINDQGATDASTWSERVWQQASQTVVSVPQDILHGRQLRRRHAARRVFQGIAQLNRLLEQAAHIKRSLGLPSSKRLRCSDCGAQSFWRLVAVRDEVAERRKGQYND